jgi:hypothetical protein
MIVRNWRFPMVSESRVASTPVLTLHPSVRSLRALSWAVSVRSSSALYTVARIEEAGTRGLRDIVSAKLRLPSPTNRTLPLRMRAVKSNFAATLAIFFVDNAGYRSDW